MVSRYIDHNEIYMIIDLNCKIVNSSISYFLTYYFVIGKYINKPLKSVLSEMRHAKLQTMDRWNIEAEIDESIRELK